MATYLGDRLQGELERSGGGSCEKHIEVLVVDRQGIADLYAMLAEPLRRRREAVVYQ